MAFTPLPFRRSSIVTATSGVYPTGPSAVKLTPFWKNTWASCRQGNMRQHSAATVAFITLLMLPPHAAPALVAWTVPGVAQYTCYRTSSPIHIDGILDEPAWTLAPQSTLFVDIVTGKPAWFDTRVPLLWDAASLNFDF